MASRLSDQSLMEKLGGENEGRQRSRKSHLFSEGEVIVLEIQIMINEVFWCLEGDVVLVKVLLNG